MADQKISDLAALTAVDDADLLVVVDVSAAETKKATKAALLSDINGLTVGRGAGDIATNTANGHSALYSNTTGAFNTASGYQALFSNTTGSYNSCHGYQVLRSNTGGVSNTASGLQALYYNTTGNYNSSHGVEALNRNTTGINNTASGYRALYSNTSASNNTASGYQALYTNITGAANTASGYRALFSNNTGDNNTASGYQALFTNTTGANNTASGYSALYYNTTGNYNSAYGYQALRLNTTGVSNTASGFTAGDVITTGSRNVSIGGYCDPSAAAGNDQVVIGYALVGKGNDTAFIGGTNGAYNESNSTTWQTTSDERIKKNIVDNNSGLDVLSQIKVRNFEYRTPDEITDFSSNVAIEKDGLQLGVIAQELQQVLPECVSESSTGVLSVDTGPLVWHLINAVKELKAEIQIMKGS
tara:strand:- start:326 stop:1576 length:1251 start_codon:yes stop_codon:yes gene_type:complete